MADMSSRVYEVEGRPVVVGKGTPYRVVAVEGDRVGDPQGLGGLADVAGDVLEPELGRVHADHDQPVVSVFRGPGPDVGELAQPVDAGIGPEVSQHDFPAQA